MATMPVQLDEQALLTEKLKTLSLPDGMTFEKVVPYDDWTGDASWQIVFDVSTRLPLTDSRMRELIAVHGLVDDLTRPLGLEKFCYIRLREVEESR